MDKKNPRVKILVACHKADPCIRRDDIYMPIQVGKALHPELDLGFQCDDTGDNISGKNGSYCELTALYWAWKNLEDADYVGLCHYRRYFDVKDDKLMDTVAKNDMVLGESKILPVSVYDELVRWTSFEDVAIFFDSILELYPEYEKRIIDFYFMSNRFPRCNMFVMTKKMFDDYCGFMFGILSLCESRLRISPYTRQRRVLGYLAETLIGLWAGYNAKCPEAVKIKECGAPKNRLMATVNDLRNSIAFGLSRRLAVPRSIPFYQAVKVGLLADGIDIRNLEK